MLRGQTKGAGGHTGPPLHVKMETRPAWQPISFVGADAHIGLLGGVGTAP